MSGQPWETHDRLCPNRRPTVAFPNSACSGCRAVVAARAEGYARGLIEGDHGGRREGYRSGYAAGKDVVMTASYAQAVAEGQRDEREACITAVESVHWTYSDEVEWLDAKASGLDPTQPSSDAIILRRDALAAIRSREEKP